MIHFLLRALFKCSMEWVPAKSVKVLIICWDFCLPAHSVLTASAMRNPTAERKWRENACVQQHCSIAHLSRHFLITFTEIYLGRSCSNYLRGSVLLVLSLWMTSSHYHHFYQSVLWTFLWRATKNSFFQCIFCFDIQNKTTRSQQQKSSTVALLRFSSHLCGRDARALPRLSEWILYN